MNRTVWDSMLCITFPNRARYAVFAVDSRNGEVIDTMDAVRFRSRANAERWVSRAQPLTISKYVIVNLR